MKTIFKMKAIFTFLVISALMVSCSSDSNDDLAIDTNTASDFDGELIVTEANVADKRNIELISGNISGANATVKVVFGTTQNMRRLYVTKSVSGAEPEPYDLGIAQAVDNKKDQSLDLNSDNKNAFEFKIKFEKPTLTNGTVVYKIWATTGRGDFRDVSKRNAIGDNVVGMITIKYGAGVNDSSGIKTFTKTMLAAPLGDGKSATFISLFNETVYKINQGQEFAALWDFGYYYGNSNKASFASTSNYPANVIDIATLTGLPKTDFNNFFFAKSNDQTVASFDAIAASADLDFIVKPTSERVSNLMEDNIVEFVDNYGKKGLIKITEIKGTDGTDGSITFDIKVQI